MPRLNRLHHELRLFTLHRAIMALQPARVLLAHDDAMVRLVLATALRDDGHEVLEADSSAALLHHVGTTLFTTGAHPPDVVITDLWVDDVSALRLLSGLRRSDWAVPIVVLNSRDEETRVAAQRLGAADVLALGFSLEDLRRSVCRLAHVPS